jgi:hypothetical protein
MIFRCLVVMNCFGHRFIAAWVGYRKIRVDFLAGTMDLWTAADATVAVRAMVASRSTDAAAGGAKTEAKTPAEMRNPQATA